MKLIEKPWGSELWVAACNDYVLKIITLKKGCRSSLQYHVNKHEHIYVDSGLVRMEVEDDNGELVIQELGPGSVVENLPGRKHRVEALEDVRLIEVSTPHLDDVVRVEDDYGR